MPCLCLLCPCSFDSKLTLEYFKLILAFPTVVLLLVGTIILLYKEDIRKLITRVRKASKDGVEFSFGESADEIRRIIADLKERQQPLKDAIDHIQDSSLKELLQKLQEQSDEAAQQQVIAATLRAQAELASAKNKRFPDPTQQEIIALRDTLLPLTAFIRSRDYVNRSTPEALAHVMQEDFPRVVRMFLDRNEPLVYEYGVKLTLRAIEAAVRFHWDVQDNCSNWWDIGK